MFNLVLEVSQISFDELFRSYLVSPTTAANLLQQDNCSLPSSQTTCIEVLNGLECAATSYSVTSWLKSIVEREL